MQCIGVSSLDPCFPCLGGGVHGLRPRKRVDPALKRHPLAPRDLGETSPPSVFAIDCNNLVSRPRNSSGNGAATRRPSRFPSCETLESWDERLRVRPTTATGRQNTSAAYGAPTQCNLLRRSAWAAPAFPIAGWIDGVAPKHEAVVAHRRPAGAAVGRPPGPRGARSARQSPALRRTKCCPHSSAHEKNIVARSRFLGVRPGPWLCNQLQWRVA